MASNFPQNYTIFDQFFRMAEPVPEAVRRTEDLKCREVKTGFCGKKQFQTGSPGTIIGWKSGKPLISLYGSEWRERILGGFNFILFFWNFNRNHTEIDRYWQKNNFLIFAKCLKMYSFFAFAF
jgi:hypothetical protein